MKTEKKRDTLKYAVKIAVLTAFAYVVMLLEFPLPIAPAFYQLDLSEVVVMIGSFAMGPLAGVWIELLKNLLHMPLSTTAFVGELANFATGCAYILPAAIWYRFRHTRATAVWGMLLGTVSLVGVGACINYFVMIPTFCALYGMELETVIAAGAAIHPAITDLPSFIALAVVPFNLIKGILDSVLVLLLYKRLSPVLHW